MTNLTPEQVAQLASAVEALRSETELNLKNHDALTQEKIARIETSVSELLDAKNAPSVPSEDEIKAECDELMGHLFTKGDRSLVRNGNQVHLHGKADPDQASLTVAAEGGYLLPKIFGPVVDQYLREKSPIRQLARVIPSKMNYVSPMKVSGATGAVRGEKDAINSTDAPTWDSITFTPFDVNAEVTATAWAIEGDATVDLVNYMIQDVIGALAETESDHFLTGTTGNVKASGGTVNNGLLSQTKLVASVTNRTATAGSMAGAETITAATLSFDDFATIRSLLNPAYSNAQWMFSKDVELKLMLITDDQGRYIWSMGDVQSGGKGRIFGDAYITSDFFPTVAGAANVPVAVYGDFSKFVIADASAPQWTIDPYTKKGWVNYFARRRTASSIVDYAAFRALYVKASG